MRSRWIAGALAAGAMIAAPSAVPAQQQPVRQAQAPKAKQPQPANPDLDVEELTPSQIQRAQEPAPPPSPKGAARAQKDTAKAPKETEKAPKETAKAAAKQPAPAPASSRAIACSGAFSKDSTHIKLATVFNSLNLTFTEVDGPVGIKVMASVLFPNDPKRRLEVWWENQAARSGIYLIVINGQSTWAAPKGLRLGLPVAALEKLNGKPFKLKGLEKDNTILVSDWNGGVLGGEFPGGCKSGVRLAADRKAAPDALAAMAGTGEFTSTDAKVRAVKPTVAEIILGF